MQKKIIYPLIIVFFWALALVSRLNFNGYVYGLDYGLFQPDGADYSFYTLTLLGKDPILSSTLVSDWYSINSLNMVGTTPREVLDGFSNFPKIRILFPLLSAPFVSLLGIKGMLVVSCFSFLITLLSIYLIGNKFDKAKMSLFLCIGTTLSPTILRWMISDCSDALFTAILSILPHAFLRQKNNLSLILIIIAASITKFSLLIFLLIAVVLFIIKSYRQALIVVIFSLIMFIPSIKHMQNSILPNYENLNLYQRIISIPISTLKVTFFELIQLAILDRLLLIFLGISIVLSIWNISLASSRYFLAILIAVFFIGGINGTLGVNFRYQLPILTFAAWVLIDSWDSFSKVFFRDIFKIRRKKTNEHLKT